MDEEYLIAADYCNDSSMDHAARVLRDDQIINGGRLSLATYFRDVLHMAELVKAVEMLRSQFPLAATKLDRYRSSIARFEFILAACDLRSNPWGEGRSMILVPRSRGFAVDSMNWLQKHGVVSAELWPERRMDDEPSE